MTLEKCRGRRWLLCLILAAAFGSARAQTASFNFSATSEVWTGWTNIAGDPSKGVQTATANGITLSSVATANWSPHSGVSAENGSGSYPGTYWPPRVMSNNWINYNGTGRSLALYNSLDPQIELSGLNPDSSYVLVISGSDASGYNSNPTQYTVAGKTNYGAKNLDVEYNTSQGVAFQGVTPDSTGTIRIYVNATSSTYIAAICGIQVYPAYVGVGTPGVEITAPANGSIWPEGSNIVIQALAQEVHDTVTKVDFYADTTKIGEVTTAPYNFTWVDPDPGAYTITVKTTDEEGTVGSASISIGVKSMNYFWSTTGNTGNNADSTFVGNVDSVRLDFRTKDIQRMSISPTGNVGIGTIAPTAMLHTTGSARLARLPWDSTSEFPRVLFSDSTGKLAYRAVTDLGLTVAGGLSETGTDTLALGDSIPGPGAHEFTSNRYQNLNDYWYSIGGSVNDPVNLPGYRIYNNGDLTASTTMDRSVNTQAQNGLRYYNKTGTLQLGASDRPDTMRNKVVTGTWQGSALVSNSDDSNSGGPKMINTIYLSDVSHIDTSITLINSLLALEHATLSSPASLSNSMLVGYGQDVTAPINNSLITGDAHILAHPVAASFIGGYQNTNNDTATNSTVAGANNQYGGPGQFTMGQFLKNRTPYGVTVGNTNVDFTSLSYTGTRGVTVSGISGYPLFVVGNSSSASGSSSSNALTVLYNGRTQINTTGFAATLSQASVTPKAALEIVSTNSGVLFPLLSASQVSAIASGDLQTGLLLYNSDGGNYQFYNGAGWQPLGFTGNITNEWQSLGNTGTSPTGNFIGTIDSVALAFRTNDSTRMTIMPNGMVGIGTTMPQTSARLAVYGAIYGQKIEATQSGWPDYVFGRKYALMPLRTLERYTRFHRRLPGMPSAAAAADGVDLGENQAALLQKVEELTLYLIEVDKQREARQTEIDQLRSQNSALLMKLEELDGLRQQLEKIEENKSRK